MAAYHRVYGFGYLRADCLGPGSALEPYACFEYGTTFTFYLLDVNTTAQALMECGETFCQLADVRYCLDDNVRLYFIEPLLNMQSMDLREIDVSLIFYISALG